MNEYSRQMINLLIEKTSQGVLSWRQGGSLGEYRTELAFATFSILRVYKANSEVITLILFKGDGREISIADMTSDEPDFYLLSTLYTAAESYYRKETEEILSVINALSKL